MKNCILLISILFFILSCTGAPEQQEQEVQNTAADRDEEEEGPELTLQRWQHAIKTEDIDLFMAQYRESPRLEIINRDGTEQNFTGKAAIRARQNGIFEQFKASPDMVLPVPQLHSTPAADRAVYRIEYREAQVTEFLFLTLRENEWKIQIQEMIFHTPGTWVTSGYQAWADENRDGFLEPEEHQRLVEAVMHTLSAPGPVSGQVGGFFDRNGDGRIDDRETETMRDLLFRKNLKRLSQNGERWAVDFFDFNNSGSFDDEEVQKLLDFFFYNQMLREPGPAETDFDGRIDKDNDGFRSKQEIEETVTNWLHIITSLDFYDELILPVPRAAEQYMDELADINNDGQLDSREAEVLTETMGHEHPAENYLDWKIDVNKNGFADLNEIRLVRQASALGKHYRKSTAEPPFRAVTPIDKMLDTDESGTVDSAEIGRIITLFSNGSGADGLPEAVRRIFDRNGDGKVGREDLELSKDVFIHPHPAAPDSVLDQKLDTNEDGFIVPEEIGIPAGVTSAGSGVPFDELIQKARWAAGMGEKKDKTAASESGGFTSEYYKRLGRIQDKKLAVVGLNIGTKNISGETARGIIVFVENAFVNVGKVRVVDRRNIEKIVEEYKFQASELTDENTAVQIGKLSGAQIIVIGSINYVGRMFYINIRLINTETGEIIGSSIAEAADDTGFLDMCNQAVFSLF